MPGSSKILSLGDVPSISSILPVLPLSPTQFVVLAVTAILGRLFSVTNVVSLSKKRRSKHTCETAQLLQDIRGDHDALCMCQLSNTDFEKDSDENGFNMSAQRENIKSHNRSKQLLIYKEKDCIKGIEMNNELNSNDPSTPYEFQATAYLPSENIDVSLGERFLNDEQDHLDLSSNSPMQNISQNFKFVCPPSFNNNTTGSDIDSNRRLNVALVSQSYPQYSVNTVKENILPRKRGNKPKSVWEKTHNAFNKTTSSAVNGSEPTVPCTLLGKQSYTQVSVEEVHVAETSRTRRRRKKKRARETLMLKRKIQRKIVQSTSFEYQSGSIKKGHTTNMDAEFSVDHSASKQHSGQLTKFNNELSLIRRTRRVFDPSVPEKYGPELLPPGWNTQIVTRKSGKTAGLIDIYFISPDGNRLRSRVEVASYIEKNGLPYLPEEFCFRRSAYKHPKC